jgi:enamine deaminase RidA (YjgF/YER057c/UK114 family)
LLEAGGSSLSNAARVDQYYTTWKAVDSYHHERVAGFGPHIPPSTSIVMDGLTCAQTDISVQVIAVCADSALSPKRVSTERLGAPMWSGFAPAVTCGDFVFVAGQMARSADGSYDARAHASPHSLWGGYEIRKQTEHIIVESLLPALEAAGSSKENALKAQAYVRHVDDIPHLLDVWDAHFGSRQVALTVVPALEFGHVSANLEINLVALRDDSAVRKQVVDAPIPAACCYGAPAVKAGDLLFLSGLMPADDRGVVTGGQAASAWPAFNIEAREQMLFLLGAADQICSLAGASLANVVRAQHFVSDPRDFPLFHSLWKQHIRSGALPWSVVKTPGNQAIPQGRLTLDLWVYAP